MGVRVFVSGNCGNQKIEAEQQKIAMVLQTRKIDCVTIDIMLPGNQNLRTFMRERGKKKEGARNVIPPQIFNGEEYRGDFDDFDIANEDDLLEEFLGLERKNPKAAPVKTGATAPEVKKLSVGKLAKEDTIGDGGKGKDSSKDDPSAAAEDTAGGRGVGGGDTAGETASDRGTDSGCVTAKDSETGRDCITGSDSETGSDSSSDGEEKAGEGTDSGIEMPDDKTEEYCEVVEDGDILDRDHEKEGSGGKRNDISHSADGDNLKNNDFGKNVVDDESNIISKEVSDCETDSDDFTDSEDDTVEYMEDGEMMRKCKPGFKQLNNCKRFWKVTNNV